MAPGASPFARLKFPVATPRLLLELPSLRRAREYPPLLGDPQVSRWLLRVPFPYRVSDARGFILRAGRTRSEGTDLALALVDRATDRLVGGIGIHGIEWKHGHGEIGYWIGRPYWGYGYASEAVQGLVAVSFRSLRLHRVEAGIFRGNSGSENVLRKAGFSPEGVRRESFRKEGAWIDDMLFGLTRSEWLRWKSGPGRAQRSAPRE